MTNTTCLMRSNGLIPPRPFTLTILKTYRQTLSTTFKGAEQASQKKQIELY